MAEREEPPAIISNPSHLLLLLVINFFWGTNVIAIKGAVAEFPPMLGTALRFAIVLLLCLPWLRRAKGQSVKLVIMGLLFGYIHFAALFWALKLAKDASTVAIGLQLAVPFSLLFAVLFLGEQVGWRRMSGVLMSFIGVAILAFDPRVLDYLPALLLAIFTSFIYAITTLIMRGMADVHPLTMQAWIAAVSVPALLITGMMTGEDMAGAIAGSDWSGWLSVSYSALLSSVVAHSGFFYLLKRYPVTVVTPYTLISPVISVLSGVLILGDHLTPLMIGGGLLTFVGVTVITLRNVKKSAS